MPGSSNPWAQELKARKPMKKHREDKGNFDPQINEGFGVSPLKTAALADKTPSETRGIELTSKIEEKQAGQDWLSETPGKHKGSICTRSNMLSNQPVGITEKPVIENANETKKISHPSPPNTKVKAPSQETENTKSLYQDARSQLRRVVTKQLSRKEEALDGQGETLGPIDQLIKQGSIDSKKQKDFPQGEILAGIQKIISTDQSEISMPYSFLILKELKNTPKVNLSERLEEKAKKKTISQSKGLSVVEK